MATAKKPAAKKAAPAKKAPARRSRKKATATDVEEVVEAKPEAPVAE